MSARTVAAYAVFVALVGALAIGFLRSAGPAAVAERERNRKLACSPLAPTPESSTLGTLPALAPSFAAKDAQGRDVALESLRGKVVLLNFWATWCPPCVEEMPSMEKLARDHAGRDDFTLLAVSVDESWDAIAQFVQRTFPKGTAMRMLQDPTKKVPGLFGTEKFPESFLIDREGKVRHYFVNKREWSGARADRCVESLLGS